MRCVIAEERVQIRVITSRHFGSDNVDRKAELCLIYGLMEGLWPVFESQAWF